MSVPGWRVSDGQSMRRATRAPLAPCLRGGEEIAVLHELFSASGQHVSRWSSLQRIAAQHDDGDSEVRLAAVVADVALRRGELAVGQVDLAVRALHELVGELVAEQPYRRRGLEALADELEIHLCGDVLIATAAERLSQAPAVDVPSPVARALELTRRQHEDGEDVSGVAA